MTAQNNVRDDSASMERYFVSVSRSSMEHSVADSRRIFLQHKDFEHISPVGLRVAQFVR